MHVHVHTSSTFTSHVSYLRRYVRGALGVSGVGWGMNIHVHVHTSSTSTSHVRSYQMEVGKWPRRLVSEDRHAFASTDELRRGEQKWRLQIAAF